MSESTISSEQILDGVLLNVHRDIVKVPDGTESVREWIDHPGASAVIPLFPDKTTILVRQFRYPPRREFLELPAGKIDIPGEDPADVARRELEEETGWWPGSLFYIGSSYPCIGYSNEIIHYYVAESLEEGRQNLSEGEHLTVERVSFRVALEMAQRGQILDMKTLTGLFLAHSWIESGRPVVASLH